MKRNTPWQRLLRQAPAQTVLVAFCLWFAVGAALVNPAMGMSGESLGTSAGHEATQAYEAASPCAQLRKDSTQAESSVAAHGLFCLLSAGCAPNAILPESGNLFPTLQRLFVGQTPRLCASEVIPPDLQPPIPQV